MQEKVQDLQGFLFAAGEPETDPRKCLDKTGPKNYQIFQISIFTVKQH